MTPIIATVVCMAYLLFIHFAVWKMSKSDRCPEFAREAITTNYLAFMAFTFVVAFILPFQLIIDMFSKKEKE